MSTDTTKTIAVVPARYGSTRFPGKMIAPIAGKPLVQHTYERAAMATLVDEVYVATDDQRIVEALKPFGTRVVMTRSDHPSGTDRIAEVVGDMDVAIVVNVQGDEPLIDPRAIDEVVRPLLEDDTLPMSTAARSISDPEEIENPNVVKVVVDLRGRALYFSRASIPYVREEADRAAAHYRYHVGLYAYRRDFLMTYSKLAPSSLERLEKLEQLRVLENGYAIAVVDTEYECIGVDTPADLERVKALIEGMGKDLN